MKQDVLFRFVRSSAFITGAVVTACGAACGPSRGSTPPAFHAEYNRDSGRLELLRHDTNANGIPETVSHLDGGRIVTVEVDLNEDGRVDRWEHYDKDGKLEKVGFSREHDGRENAWSYADATGAVIRIDVLGATAGRVIRTEHFDRGALVRAEEDTDADGMMDKSEVYEGGRLVRLAFAAGPDRPAHALVYAPDGSVRIE
jgi:hypothetical protein